MSVGKELQRRRQYDDAENFDCYLRPSRGKGDVDETAQPMPEDPAEKDPEMMKRLEENQRTAQENLNKVRNPVRKH